MVTALAGKAVGMDGLSELISEMIDTTVSSIVEIVGEMTAAFGNPFGFVRGDMWEELEQYIDHRDDANWWQTTITTWSQSIGMEAALVVAQREDTRLNEALARKGGWSGYLYDLPRAQAAGAAAIRSHFLQTRGEQAKQANADLQRLRGLAKAYIVPLLPPYDDATYIADAYGLTAPPDQSQLAPNLIGPGEVPLGPPEAGTSLAGPGAPAAGPGGGAAAPQTNPFTGSYAAPAPRPIRPRFSDMMVDESGADLGGLGKESSRGAGASWPTVPGGP